MSYRVAITGATGFIGSALAHRLHDSGWRVRALLRSPSKRERLPNDIECVHGSLDNAAALRTLLADSDTVVHCAGLVRGAVESRFFDVNVSALERFVDLASDCRPTPPYFLLLSSLAAREPALSPYAASKLEGEAVLSRCAGAMPWLALRPPAVYGPGDRDMLPLFKLMASGVAPVIGDGSARFSMIYVEDLVDAVGQCLAMRASTQNGVVDLCDGRPRGYSWEEAIAIAARVCKRNISRLRIPPTILEIIGATNTISGRILGYAPMLTSWKLRELRHSDWVCDNTAIQSLIDWRPTVQFEEGLRRTLGLAENP